MLRVSAQQTDRTADIRLVNGEASAEVGDIAYARELVAFAESLARRDEPALALARQNLLEQAGAAVLVDTAGVAANFQRMVRIADSAGIPIDQHNHNPLAEGVRTELDLQRFPSARNSQVARDTGMS